MAGRLATALPPATGVQSGVHRRRRRGSQRLKVHAARHHWAVTHLRAGVPLEVVRRQLGHSTPMLTLQIYGAFVPTGEDRAHWERQVTRAEDVRRAR